MVLLGALVIHVAGAATSARALSKGEVPRAFGASDEVSHALICRLKLVGNWGYLEAGKLQCRRRLGIRAGRGGSWGVSAAQEAAWTQAKPGSATWHLG